MPRRRPCPRRASGPAVAAFQGPWELYDLTADRTETHDLASAQPDTVAELRVLWEAWAERVGVVPWEVMMASLRFTSVSPTDSP